MSPLRYDLMRKMVQTIKTWWRLVYDENSVKNALQWYKKKSYNLLTGLNWRGDFLSSIIMCTVVIGLGRHVAQALLGGGRISFKSARELQQSEPNFFRPKYLKSKFISIFRKCYHINISINVLMKERETRRTTQGEERKEQDEGIGV